jgi:hypothetical protein
MRSIGIKKADSRIALPVRSLTDHSLPVLIKFSIQYKPHWQLRGLTAYLHAAHWSAGPCVAPVNNVGLNSL